MKLLNFILIFLSFSLLSCSNNIINDQVSFEVISDDNYLNNSHVHEHDDELICEHDDHLIDHDNEYAQEINSKGDFFNQRNEIIINESNFTIELIMEAPDNEYRQGVIAAPLASIYENQLFIYRIYPVDLNESYVQFYKSLIGEKEIEVYNINDLTKLSNKIHLNNLDGVRSLPLKLYVCNDKIYVLHLLYDLAAEVGPKQLSNDTITRLNVYDFNGEALYTYDFSDIPQYFFTLEMFVYNDDVYFINQWYDGLNEVNHNENEHDNNHTNEMYSGLKRMYENIDENSGNRRIRQINISTDVITFYDIDHLYYSCLYTDESLLILNYEIDDNYIVNAVLYEYHLIRGNKTLLSSFPATDLPFPFVDNLHYSKNENVVYLNFYGTVYYWDFINNIIEPIMKTNEYGRFQNFITFDNKVYINFLSGETYINTINPK